MPWDLKHKYDLAHSDQDRFRMSLFIIGILFTFYLMIVQIFKVFRENKFEQVIIFIQFEMTYYCVFLFKEMC